MPGQSQNSSSNTGKQRKAQLRAAQATRHCYARSFWSNQYNPFVELSRIGGILPPIIDSPRPQRSTRGRRRLVLLAGLLFAVLLGSRTALSYWVDLLWFRALGYGGVFWKTLGIQASVFCFFSVASFLVLYYAFTALHRSHRADLPSAHGIVIAGQTINLSIAPLLRVLSFVLSFIMAGTIGLSMVDSWPTLALFFYAPHTSVSVDPIFGKSLGFFLFTLPAWQLIDGWLLTLAITTSVAALLLLTLSSSARALDKRTTGYADSPWRGLSLSVAFTLFILALITFVSRYQALLEHHTIFDGATYTDVHVTIPGLLLVCAALIAGAGIAAWNAFRRPTGQRLLLSVIPAVVCYSLLGVVGWYVSNFIVKPNELVRERPFIAHNIESTRQAYGLDRFTQREFPAETTVDAVEAASNQPTLQNIRLWDWHALQDTLRQIQEIRTYYDFPEIDIDRYTFNGTKQEVMLSARELDVDKLPVSSRNWINQKLIYTHGYGVTMNPVNGFTPEGLPNLLLSNMPVQSTVSGLAINRPEIYYGELTDTDVYVKTRQQEFNYPQGQNNNLTTYQGEGGIELGGITRRILLSIDRGDLGKLPFSDDVGPQSQLLMRRNIRTRVATLAPFLTLDQDPYLVVGEDGRLRWIMDAFTASSSYPYATPYSFGDTAVNYIRNSVKVVVDAYDGTTTFYAFDTHDPILAAYMHIYPGLFHDAASMPADLLRHVRYPEALLKIQSEAYGLYHMTNPDVFFNREDLWTVATETQSDSNGEHMVQGMQPNYVLMKLPGGTSEEFVAILPFTPANRNNLIGWIAARCDGPAYGSAIVYDFPKTRLVDGPQQIEARIDQNAQLSGQLTLWNQQGSHVLRGNLLVIPSGRALLYAEPIYLQAQESPMPELRLVVLALQDKLAYGPTFQAALASLFDGRASSMNASEGVPDSGAAPQTSSAAPAGVGSLIAEAGRDFADYQKLTAAGKLGEAGQKLDALKRALEDLQAHAK